MRKVVVLHPPINYVVLSPRYKQQIAWFLDPDDAQDFVNSQLGSEDFVIAEVRK